MQYDALKIRSVYQNGLIMALKGENIEQGRQIDLHRKVDARLQGVISEYQLQVSVYEKRVRREKWLKVGIGVAFVCGFLVGR